MTNKKRRKAKKGKKRKIKIKGKGKEFNISMGHMKAIENEIRKNVEDAMYLIYGKNPDKQRPSFIAPPLIIANIFHCIMKATIAIKALEDNPGIAVKMVIMGEDGETIAINDLGQYLVNVITVTNNDIDSAYRNIIVPALMSLAESDVIDIEGSL